MAPVGRPPTIARLHRAESQIRVAEVMDAVAVVVVHLDQEFLPPWRATQLGRPRRLSLRLTPDLLAAAADEWDEEIAPLPDDTDPEGQWQSFLRGWKQDRDEAV